MSIKVLIVAAQMLLMTCLANAQPFDNLTNLTTTAMVPIMILPTGSISSTTTCRMIDDTGFRSLKGEMIEELNKAKAELRLSNHREIDEWCEKSDRKFSDAVEKAESALQRRFKELKEAIDVLIGDNEDALCWFGVLSALVGILATIFGLIFPFVSEMFRRYNYKKLTQEFCRQRDVSLKLIRELNDQMNETKGMIALSWGERMAKECFDRKLQSSAEVSIKMLADAVHYFILSNSSNKLSVAVALFYVLDDFLSKSGFDKNKLQECLKKTWRWPMPLNCAKKAFEALKPEDAALNGDFATLEKIYNEYGMPR